MLKFSHFKILKEELNDQQKQEVSSWKRDPEAVAATDHYFGKGNDDIHHKLEHVGKMGNEMKSAVHNKVEEHLGQHISHEDYKQGVTSDKYGRQVKIGRLIKDEGLRNQFANDSTRQGKRFNGLTVHVTRSPAGVCGQTSGNQSWSQESCKNFETGINRRYLKDEVEHGTVVGYLKDHTGRELARATLQPHINDIGHRAYAVDAHYGIDHEQFKQHMEKVALDLSGPHKGGSYEYQKHPKVYDDSGEDSILHPNINSHHISSILSDPNSSTSLKRHALKNPNATEKQLTNALASSDTNIRVAVFKNPNATEEHISKGLMDKSQYVRNSALTHPKAEKYRTLVKSIDNHYIKPETLNKIIDAPHVHPYLKSVAAENSNASAETIHKALSSEHDIVKTGAVRNKNLQPEHITKILENPKNMENNDIRQNIIYHEKLQPHHITTLLNMEDKNHNIHDQVIRHPNATPEHYQHVLRNANNYSGKTVEHTMSSIRQNGYDFDATKKDDGTVEITVNKRK